VDLLRAGFFASPLLRELEALTRRDGPYPESQAKRHHLVPAFLLRRFIRPGSERPRVVQLDLRSGRPQPVDPATAASRTRFYRVTDDDGTTHQRVEFVLSIIEDHAADALARLVANPVELSPADRATLAVFFSLLEARTIAGLEKLSRLAETSLRYFAAGEFADRAKFAEMYREAVGQADDATIERQRQDMIASLTEGRIRLANPQEVALGLMFEQMTDSAQLIYQMDWEMLDACAGAFVTSDRALAMHDPTPEYPWSGHAILSSPNAETTIPLDPSRCLRLTPMDRPQSSTSVATIRADARLVAEINLRTYGFATSYIFADSQETASVVRRDAKRRPRLVVRPRPFRQAMLIDAEAGDDRLAREHRERGWPERFQVRGELHDYVVLDEDENVVEQSIDFSELGRARAARRLGSDNLESSTVAIHPGELIPHSRPGRGSVAIRKT
jgi:hypothetical protein